MSRLADLVIWISLRLREVTGSNLERALKTTFILTIVWSLRITLSLSVKYRSQVRFSHYLFPLLVYVLVYHSGIFIVELLFGGCCRVLLDEFKTIGSLQWGCRIDVQHTIIFLLTPTTWIEKLVWFNSFLSVCSLEASLAQVLEHWSSKPGVRFSNLRWGLSFVLYITLGSPAPVQYQELEVRRPLV